jgi:hypothetical protein
VLCLVGKSQQGISTARKSRTAYRPACSPDLLAQVEKAVPIYRAAPRSPSLRQQTPEARRWQRESFANGGFGIDLSWRRPLFISAEPHVFRGALLRGNKFKEAREMNGPDI